MSDEPEEVIQVTAYQAVHILTLEAIAHQHEGHKECTILEEAEKLMRDPRSYEPCNEEWMGEIAQLALSTMAMRISRKIRSEGGTARVEFIDTDAESIH